MFSDHEKFLTITGNTFLSPFLFVKLDFLRLLQNSQVF